MATEEIWIKGVRFRDPDGKPTCIADFGEGECCDHLNNLNQCTFLNYAHPKTFKTSEGWLGLKPLKNCPFWQKDIEVVE